MMLYKSSTVRILHTGMNEQEERSNRRGTRDNDDNNRDNGNKNNNNNNREDEDNDKDKEQWPKEDR